MPLQKKKIRLIFRLTRINRYSLSALAGIIDNEAEEEGLKQQVEMALARTSEEIDPPPHRRPTIAAYSFMTHQLREVAGEIRSLKAADPSLLLIAGGPHASADPQGVLRMGFDHVFVGEAEQTFTDFLHGALKSGNDFASEPGGNIHKASQQADINDYRPFSPSLRLAAPMEISRGCGYACLYCQTPRIYRPPLRHRTPENIARCLSVYKSSSGRFTRFVSPNAFGYMSENGRSINHAAIERLLREVSAIGVEKIYFGCFPAEVRPEWIDEEVLELVKRYCVNETLVIGAQAGSDKVLHMMGRGHSVADVDRASLLTRRAGFTPHLDFMIGIPRETYEDRMDTLRMIDHLIGRDGARIHMHRFIPLPATPFWKRGIPQIEQQVWLEISRRVGQGRLDGFYMHHDRQAQEIQALCSEGLITV